MRQYTFGTEIELGDINTNKGLPEGCSNWSLTEYDLISKNIPYRGLPNDPKRKIHSIGGELNTIPSNDIQTQILTFKNILKLYPEATISHRFDLHTHISYPGLKNNLNDIKKILKYSYKNGEKAVKLLYNMTKHCDMCIGDWQFYKVNMGLIPEWKYKRAMNAETFDDFILSFQCDTKGNYNPRLTRRYYINFFSLKKHGTLEYRANFPTLNPNELHSCLEYLKRFVNEALSDNPISIDLIIMNMRKEGFIFPKEQPYDHELQCAWRFCSFPNVKYKMIERWKQFYILWYENKKRFFKNNWYNEKWAK